jgi:hypothetical protein
MIDLPTALAIAAKEFPNGPEAVAAEIGARVIYSELKGCEGWCVRGQNRIAIRIKNSSSTGRQRFTLAHELSHLLLDEATDVWDVDSARVNEEETVNQIAAVMLLPTDELFGRVGKTRPIPQSVVSQIAREARVSEMMVARRIVALRGQLGIDHAFMAGFMGGRFQWAFPNGVVTQRRASEIYFETAKAPSESLDYKQGKYSVRADVLSTPAADTLLVQSYEKAF